MSSPPRRRSSRLRGANATPTKPQPHTMHRLSALAEHDETPNSPILYNMNSILSSPLASIHTPAAAGRIQPSRDQMHPSLAKPSTAKEPDAGLVLGFTDIPSGPQVLSTPSKIGLPSPSPFNFGFTAPTPQLGEEAQKLMDSLREDATKIKAKLTAQHEEEKRNGGESSIFGARKIAQPKPKAGRYSDAHREEFRKMDSIAAHPSAFRAQLARPTTSSALKRSQSKAKLDEPEEHQTLQKQPAKSLKRSQSKAQLDEPVGDTESSQGMADKSGDRVENVAPAKRARQQITDDASTARPVSRGGIPVPSNQKPKPTFRSRFDAGLKSLTTPTKASAARASGLKQPQMSSIPASSSMANINTTPRGLVKSKTTSNLSGIPRPESTKKVESTVKEPPTMSRLDRFKSILHRNPSPSKAAASNPTSIPSLKKSPTKKDLGKDLPPIPVTPGKDEQPQTAKHVSFTTGTVAKHDAAVHETPSPKKSGIPRSATMKNMGPVTYPSLSTSDTPVASNEIKYPALFTPRPIARPVKQAVTEPHRPPMFTFRGDQDIDFGSSPGQTSVRAVRPSILPSQIPGSFPIGDQENAVDFQTIPHGMSNKKRRRASSDVGREEEDATEADGQSPSKKLKSRAAEGQMLVESLQRKILPGGKNSPRKMSRSLHNSPIKNASPSKSRGVLSLSRLNMLARPKTRK